ncbi:Tat pathway signal protein [Streptomyces sp. NPDC127068]|uniref:Tat pathway signal protein n=1 Tax=Streptomyces sp. NPDC127068 TaxID=3347127 RepID=UPI003667487C
MAAELGARELTTVTRSHVSQWVLGSRPSASTARIVIEALSRGLGRTVTLREIGFSSAEDDTPAGPDWTSDTTSLLAELGENDLDRRRRKLLATSAYSLAGLALPLDTWWDEAPVRAARKASTASATVTPADVEGVREVADFFSRRDQMRGGTDGRAALVAYLRTDMAACLKRRPVSDAVRRDLHSAAGELVYLAGWTAFDSREHRLAQHWFTLAVRLAAEADDAPLAGHVLRAMAHQAADLGHGPAAVDLAAASLERGRYTRATPRERALLGVVHARALASDGQRRAAVAALRRAENDLDQADSAAQDEPRRVFFFQQASLAHETARTLHTLGDLNGAVQQFTRSTRLRRKQTFRRTHSVTLDYLGAAQVQQGALDAAIATWTEALDSMDGVHSGRARETVVQMRRALSPFRQRGHAPAAELDDRARTVLGRIG